MSDNQTLSPNDIRGKKKIDIGDDEESLLKPGDNLNKKKSNKKKNKSEHKNKINTKDMVGEVNDYNNSLPSSITKKNSDSSSPTKKGREGHLMITDVAMHFDELDAYDRDEDLWRLTKRNLDTWALLVMLAGIAAVVSVLFSYCVDSFVKKVMYEYFFKSKNVGYFFAALGVSIGMAWIGTFICNPNRDAEGSGIPELKSILAGISIYKYLSLKTLIAKVAALFFAQSSGLFLGREGPFVHISAAIANNLAKFQCFKRLHEKNTFRKQILATAAGIGITSTFGTPIGGCLYSIETMSTFFAVGAFGKAFFCAFICGLILHLLRKPFDSEPEPVEYEKMDINKITEEIIAFMFLGLITGLIGIIHNNTVVFCIKQRRKLKNQYLNRLGWTAFVCIFTITTSYWYMDFGFLGESSIEHLFSTKDGRVTDKNYEEYWLLGLLAIKLFSNALALSCPLPSGIFVPMFLSGAILGRTYGIFMNQWFGITDIGRFAVVGAASLVASVTHTLAITVITFELIGQYSILYPMLISVVMSYGLSKWLSHSIYHMVVELKNLPFLPKLLEPSQYKKSARDIMVSEFPYLTLTSTVQDIVLALNEVEYKVLAIPIVDDEHSFQLVFSVQTANLRDYLNKLARVYKASKANFEENCIASGLLSSAAHNMHVSMAVPKKNFKNLMKRLESVPPMHQDSIPKDIQDLHDISVSEPFWQQVINYNHPKLNVDRSPFTVFESVKLVKIHYLFTMLGLNQVFVMNRGKLAGMITLQNFQKK